MREGRAVCERLRDVDDGVQRLVVDLDELCRVLRLRARLGDHDGDAVALVARRVGQRIVRRVLHVLGDRPGARHRRLPVVLQVGGGERRDDAVGLPRRVEIDALHAGVCVRAADDDHADRARRGHVVDVRAVAGEERRVLAALDGRADVAGLLRRGAHDARPIVAAASWTATTMLWYPVQRQRLPSRPSRMAASLVASPCSISDTAAITMPGVQ